MSAACVYGDVGGVVSTKGDGEMRKSTMMVAAAFLLAMGTVYGQCGGGGCCWLKKNLDGKKTPKSCPMKKSMSPKDFEKMMLNCPMLKGKSDAEKKKIIANCPMMKYMKSKNKKPLTKAEMAKMMANCPMMKGKTDAEKKKMMASCPMGKCMAMMMAKTASAGKVQTTCPVMGGKINKKFYADVKGKRVYVCCPGCVAKVKADPDKYIKKLEDAGVKLEDAPKK